MTTTTVKENPTTLGLPLRVGIPSSIALLPTLEPIGGARVRNLSGRPVYWSIGSAIDRESNNGVLHVEEAPQTIQLHSNAWNLSFYPEADGTLEVEISPDAFDPLSDWQRTVQWINQVPLVDETIAPTTLAPTFAIPTVNVEQWQAVHLVLSVQNISASTHRALVTFDWSGTGGVVARRKFNIQISPNNVGRGWEWRLPNVVGLFDLSVEWETPISGVQYSVEAYLANPISPIVVNVMVPSELGFGPFRENDGLRGTQSVAASSAVVATDSTFSGYTGAALLACHKAGVDNAGAVLEADRRDGDGFQMVAAVRAVGEAQMGASQMVFVPPNICRVSLRNDGAVNRNISWAITPQVI
jgi:hypothetical protein